MSSPQFIVPFSPHNTHHQFNHFQSQAKSMEKLPQEMQILIIYKKIRY